MSIYIFSILALNGVIFVYQDQINEAVCLFTLTLLTNVWLGCFDQRDKPFQISYQNRKAFIIKTKILQ